jgi:hypothetical protein
MRGPKDGHQSRFAPPPPDAELPLFQLEGLGNLCTNATFSRMREENL